MNTTTTMYGIKDVCKKFDLSEVYVRRMILKGKIQTTKIEIRTNTFKHMITEEEILRWRASVSSRSRREDGRSKFSLYSTLEEFEKIQTLLSENGIESIVQRTNKVKNIE